MDWSAWFKSRCRSRSWWYVYLAFAGTGFHGKDGWSGKSRTVFRTGRKRKSTRFCADRCAAIYFYGTGLRYFMPHFCPADGRIFKLNDPEAVSAALSYTKIACGLIVFSFLTVTLTGIYTAQGDSKTPFLANLIGLVTNMILDPVLILGPGPFPKLGVTGAAIATVTAQFIVMSIMIICVIKQKKKMY